MQMWRSSHAPKAQIVYVGMDSTNTTNLSATHVTASALHGCPSLHRLLLISLTLS
jgi:hypothetical protein